MDRSEACLLSLVADYPRAASAIRLLLDSHPTFTGWDSGVLFSTLGYSSLTLR